MRRAFCLALLLAASAACGGSSAATCELASDCAGTASFCEVVTGECIAPPSLDACNRVETCTLADKPYCTDDSMGVCVECTDGSHCGDGEVCDQGSNECIVLACTEGTAGDAQCAAADPSLAYCGPDESCVACLESAHCTAADSAICDPNDLECRGCIANSECESKVCGTDTGICADEAGVVYVAKAANGGADGAGCGTLASPCLTIDGDEGGLAKVTASRKTVVVGAGSYPEQIEMAAGTVSIIADGMVVLNPPLDTATDRVVEVTGTANVSLVGVVVDPGNSDPDSDAVACIGSTATLSITNSTITTAQRLGVVVQSCSVSITGSTISSNLGGGIEINNSDYTIVNNFILNNGQDGVAGSGRGGVTFSTTSDKLEEFNFNTVFGNGIGNGELAGSGVSCSGTNLSATSNIIVTGGQGGGLGLVAGNCTHSYSLIEGAMPFTGMGNIIGDPLFVNAGEGNYHLQLTSPCIDAADPAATLDIDIDGNFRPQGDARDMGADEAG